MDLQTILKLTKEAFNKEISASVCGYGSGTYAIVEGEEAFMLALEKILQESTNKLQTENKQSL